MPDADPRSALDPRALWPVIVKTIGLVVLAAVALWFLKAIADVLMMFFLALVLTIVMNVPVSWLERRGVSRIFAAVTTVFVALAMFATVVWVATPPVLNQASALADNLPDYISSVQVRLENAASGFPRLQESLQVDKVTLKELIPSLQSLLTHLGRYTLDILVLIFILAVVLSAMFYALLQPRPLIESFLELFPGASRERAARALVVASRGVVGWVWSNIIVGGIEAVLVGFMTSYLGLPGVFVWAALAFGAELLPRIGIYIAAAPPMLVALAIDPMKALWLGVFFLVMNETTGNLIAPPIRGKTMKLHPVSMIFAMAALGYAFGLLGAIMSVPITAFVKAFYDEFYGRDHPQTKRDETWVERILSRKTHGSEPSRS